MIKVRHQQSPSRELVSVRWIALSSFLTTTANSLIVNSIIFTGPLNFIQVPPSPLRLLQGKNASLTCSADGLPTPTITWELNGESLTKDSKEASIDIVNIRHNAKYSCIAESGTRRKEKIIEIVVLGMYYSSFVFFFFFF